MTETRNTRTRPARSTTPRCEACGSTASVIRASASRKRTLELCYGHEAVCWDHLADPCDVCDTK